ncbi:MAG: hypothetical protein II978_09145, partial [Clostridia bacterium]|nr:hypothetical protein [Clostridia bacterium]
NGIEIANSVPWNQPSVSNSGVSSIRWAKRNSATINTLTYADDMTYSKAIYVTDTVKFVPVTTTLEQGDASEQTATVALNMSDGTTKNFTVKYTVDTKTAGTKTADGAIDGIDGAVPVTYTVNASNVPTVINKIEGNENSITQVILNNNTALEDGTKLFVAVYDAQPRVMKSISIVPLTVAQRAAGAQTIALPEALTANTGKVVKAFVLDNKFEPQSMALEKMQ